MFRLCVLAAVGVCAGSAVPVQGQGMPVESPAGVRRPAAAPGDPRPRPDFNGDGYADLAVGVPGEDVGGVENAGAVAVIYGTRLGLHGDLPVDDQFWTEAGLQRSDIVSEDGDQFGSALAAGDFNGDGFDDLAIGVPREGVSTAAGNVRFAGTVYVLKGSRSGLTAVGPDILTQDSPGIAGSVGSRERFGAALAAGNFGRGIQDDLAIGVPGDDVGEGSSTVRNTGSVNVLYGSSGGLTASGNRLWHQNAVGIPGAAEGEDEFGFSLEAANLGRSREADLVVGAPYEDLGEDKRDAGVVHVIYGSGSGLTRRAAQMWHQDNVGIPGVAESGDRFGWALAAADFGNGTYEDLAVGVPYEDAGSVDAGAVSVLYGSPPGLTANRARLWYQGSTGISGDPEEGDHFGFALAAANFGAAPTSDPRADLAVGVPGEDDERLVGTVRDVGAVNLIFGSGSGLTATSDHAYSQDSSGIGGAVEGESERSDLFGWALTAADFGKGAVADLAVGVPGETREPTIGRDLQNVGAVNVLYGDGKGGLRAGDDQFWWQASDTLHDSGEDHDRFGSALAR
jgi:hypothetical protein